MTRFLLLLSLASGLAACDSHEGDPNAPDLIGDLAGTEWVLQSLGDDTDVPEATLRFNRDLRESALSTDTESLEEWVGSVQGQAACNTYTGEYRYTQGGISSNVQLSLTVSSFTEASCGPDDLFEAAFFAAIDQSVGWSRNGDRFFVTAPGGDIALEFERD